MCVCGEFRRGRRPRPSGALLYFRISKAKHCWVAACSPWNRAQHGAREPRRRRRDAYTATRCASPSWATATPTSTRCPPCSPPSPRSRRRGSSCATTRSHRMSRARPMWPVASAAQLADRPRLAGARCDLALTEASGEPTDPSLCVFGTGHAGRQPTLTRTPRSLRTVRTSYAYQPPA